MVQDGYDRASTNRIAVVAGVGIGSLYQYFPNKEALVAALVERHSQELWQIALSAVLRVSERPLAIGLREIVSAAIAGHRQDPALHRVLAEQVPRVGKLADIDAVQRNGRTLIRTYLEGHREEIDVADLDLAAFVVVTTVEALTHAAVLDRPQVLADGREDGFLDDVTRLLLGYLRATPIALATAAPAQVSA